MYIRIHLCQEATGEKLVSTRAKKCERLSMDANAGMHGINAKVCYWC